MTRGSVAWQKISPTSGHIRIQGVYSNSDSYPVGLGNEVFSRVKDLGVLKTIEVLAKTKVWDIEYRHEDPKLFNPFRDPLFMEWIYLLKPVELVVEVWKCVPVCKKLKAYCAEHGYTLSGRKHSYGHCVYTHLLVDTVKEHETPDVAELEAKGHKLSEEAHELEQ